MKRRKGHQKSRRGCLNCKTRHVKCDEIRPRCGHCRRLGDHCVFPVVVPGQYALSKPLSLSATPVPPRSRPPGAPNVTANVIATLDALNSGRLAHSASYQLGTADGASTAIAAPTDTVDSLPHLLHSSHPSPPLPTLSPPPRPSSSSPPAALAPPREMPCRDMLDLRLLHHYTARTYKTWDLDSHKTISRTWQDSVVRLACATQHCFLLHGLLAWSACHLTLDASESLHDRVHVWPKRAVAHFDSAITGFRTMLERAKRVDDVGKDTSSEPAASSEAIFIFGCILVVYSFADARLAALDPHDGISKLQQKDALPALLASFRLVRGAGVLLQPHFEAVMKSEFAPLVADARVGDAYVPVEPLVQLRSWITSYYTLNHADPSGNHAKMTACLDALANLQRVIATVQYGTVKCGVLSQCFNWPVQINGEFMTYLEQREPVALVILAHFATLLSVRDECWWLAGWDKLVLGAIEHHLQQATELLPWLAWPKQMIMGN